ncbi:SH3 domain-containing protein [Candidatus Amarolinea aalborgensis]|uniref:SH3 domain-containing protein n=1 Tax=Candidatus Amarolinea aalborgensis TaxID=2249329 RepID=UPI003BFA264C
MTRTQRFAIVSTMLGVLLVILACGGASTQVDRSQVATEVAGEILATVTAEAQAAAVKTQAEATPTFELSPTTERTRTAATPKQPEQPILPLKPTATSAIQPADTLQPTSTPTAQPSNTPQPTSTPTAQPSNTPQPTSTPTVQPSNTPQPTSTPTATAQPRSPAVGDTVTCGKYYEITVLQPPSYAKNLKSLDTWGLVRFLSDKQAKGQWMAVQFQLKNTQSETASLSLFSNEVVVTAQLDGASVTFAPDKTSLIFADQASSLSQWYDDIPPGVAIRTIALFDINPAGTQRALVLKPSGLIFTQCEVEIRLDQLADVASDKPVVIVSQEANVRSGPGTTYGVLGKATAGQRFEIVGRNTDSSWWQVLYIGKKGWVAASIVKTAGPTNQVAVATDIPKPPPPPATAIPLPKTRPEQEFIVKIWGLKLYDVKRSKTVYWFGNGTFAQGTYLIPLVEFRNTGSGTATAVRNLNFYLQDAQGRTYKFDPFGDAVLGAAWQFHAGHLYDDISPGLTLGIALPFDVSPDLGDVWLRVKEDPKIVMYLGNVSQLPESK